MKNTPAEHATLTVERHMEAPATRVFAAWASAEAKRQWFACHDEWGPSEYSLDFRIGGVERNNISDTDGILHAYEARYMDIVPNARIVYAYDMKLGDTRISVSLATVTFEAVDAGTRMLFTEQVVFLEGYADNGSRLQGTEILIDRNQAFVESEAGIVH